MKIGDMVVSGILKKGILYESDNCDIGVEIPTIQKDGDGKDKEVKVVVHIKADHMTLRIEKGE